MIYSIELVNVNFPVAEALEESYCQFSSAILTIMTAAVNVGMNFYEEVVYEPYYTVADKVRNNLPFRTLNVHLNNNKIVRRDVTTQECC